MTAANANVGLSVRIGAADGYTQATLNANQTNPQNNTYYYKYTGGTDGNGNVTESGRGAVDIFVTLGSEPRYAIAEVGLPPNAAQLRVTHTDATHATVHDLNTQDETDYYNVLIADSTNGNCQFWCDPRVTNTD